MRLLTLNTHSLIEDNYEKKLTVFTDAIAELVPDIIALQEVNQTVSESELLKNYLDGSVNFDSCRKIKSDNHAASVNRILREKGIKYNWVWIPIKNGFEKYDEGISIFSLSPITDVRTVLLSEKDDYFDWHTRKAVGIKSSSGDWYYSVHFGLNDDLGDNFASQWERFLYSIDNKEKTVIMGDFNFPQNSSNVKLVENSGFFDTYRLSAKKDSGVTVCGNIAGWETDFADKRLDYIWVGKKMKIKTSKVIFNGRNREIVSDHYGVLVEY